MTLLNGDYSGEREGLSLELALLMQAPRPDPAASRKLLATLDRCIAELTARKSLMRNQHGTRCGLTDLDADLLALRMAKARHCAGFLN